MSNIRKPTSWHHQVACEALRRLNNDGSRSVAIHARERRREARPALDRVGAANGRVIEPVDDFVAGALRVTLDSPALADLRVLALPTFALQLVRKYPIASSCFLLLLIALTSFRTEILRKQDTETPIPASGTAMI
jgi:hypothetical protein